MEAYRIKPTDNDLLEWRNMYDDFYLGNTPDTLWKRQIVEDFHRNLISDCRRMVLQSDRRHNQNGIHKYLPIPREEKSVVYVHRMIHNLKDFDEYVKLASGDFELNDMSRLDHFAFDFQCAFYRHFRFWRDEECNFKIFSPKGQLCINKNYGGRGFIDDIRPKILPELIEQKQIMNFLFFDPFEIHFTRLN